MTTRSRRAAGRRSHIRTDRTILGRLFLAVALSVGGATPAFAAAERFEAPSGEASHDPSAVAKELYATGRYLEAARAYERLFRESARPGNLFNAGMAREAAGPGNDALAIRHWRRYLEVAGASASAEERADLAQRIAGAEQRTVAVELVYTARAGDPAPQQVELRRGDSGDVDVLTIEWPSQPSVALHLDHGEWTAVVAGAYGALSTRRFTVERSGSQPLRVVLTDEAPAPATAVDVHFGPRRALARGIEVDWEGPTEVDQAAGAVREGDVRWTLSPGQWTLRARAPGFATRESEVRVGDSPLRVGVRLRRDRESRARIGVAVAGGVAGVGMIVGGAALIAGRRSALRGVFDDALKPVEESGPALADIRLSSAGMILIGAGGGAGVVAVTVAAGGKKRALVTEAVLGGAVLAVGIPLHLDNLNRCFLSAKSTATVEGCYHAGLPRAAVMGFGAGLLGTSILALVTQAATGRSAPRTGPRRAPDVAAQGGPTGASLSVSGRF